MKRLVLLGAGHTHVEVLRRFALRPPADAALTVISPYTHVPYTGMIPGVVAGRYQISEASIGARALAARAGAAFIQTRAIGVDRRRKVVSCENGEDIAFDILSINIGASTRDPLRRAAGAQVIATKPVEPFIDALEKGMPDKIAVIGGGYGGVELAAALAHRGARVTLVAGGEGPAPRAPRRARAMIGRRLAARGVAVVAGDRAISADAQSVRLADGRFIAADAVILAAGVVPPALISLLDLPKDARGFLRLSPSLQSEGDSSIFAAGDAGAPAGLDKAGVYAVRQGPVLAFNLDAALSGAPLRAFNPQAEYLAILSFWPDGAVAIRGGLAAEGRWADRWKETIDRRFIARYFLGA